MSDANRTRVFSIGGLAVGAAPPPAAPRPTAAPPARPAADGWARDAAGRPLRLDRREGAARHTTEARYDARGRLAAVRPPGSDAWIEYEYDGDGPPVAVHVEGRLRVSRERTPDGGALVGGNGVRVDYVVGRAGLTAIRVTGGDRAVGLDYAVDDAGQVIRAGEVGYGYDEAGRLSRAAGPDRQLGWEYDDGGRMVAAVAGGRRTEWRVDAAGRLLAERAPDGTVRRFEHDLAGRRVAARGAEVLEYRYGRHGRLAEVRRAGRVLASYGYDAAGRVAWRRAGGTLTAYHYGPQGHLLAESDGAGRILATHVRLGRTEVARVLGPLDAGPVRYVHLDHTGSLRAVTGPGGETAWSGSYEAYGTPVGGAPPGGHVFMGHRRDEVTGLYDFGARWYDPATARFLTPDPCTGDAADPRLAGASGPARAAQLARWQGANQLADPYALCGNNPVCFVDPDGRWAVGWVLLNIVLGTLWALPYTLLGLSVAVLNIVLQLLHPIFDLLGAGWEGLGFDADACGALNTYGVFFGGGLLGTILKALNIDALTMGNSIWKTQNPALRDCKGASFTLADLNRHELRHTNQYEWLGPFFMIFYLFDAIINGYCDALTETDARQWQTRTC